MKINLIIGGGISKEYIDLNRQSNSHYLLFFLFFSVSLEVSSQYLFIYKFTISEMSIKHKFNVELRLYIIISNVIMSGRKI